MEKTDTDDYAIEMIAIAYHLDLDVVIMRLRTARCMQCGSLDANRVFMIEGKKVLFCEKCNEAGIVTDINKNEGSMIMLGKNTFAFDNSDLQREFDDAIIKIGRELTSAGAMNLYGSVVSVFVENFKDESDDIQVADASQACDELNEIIEKVKVRAMAIAGDGHVVAFTRGEFHVISAARDGHLARVSVVCSRETQGDFNLVEIQDAWNDVYSTLGVDAEVIEKLDEAGIDPADFDHQSGDSSNDRECDDYYYALPDVDGFDENSEPELDLECAVFLHVHVDDLDRAIKIAKFVGGGEWEHVSDEDDAIIVHRVA